MELDVVVLLTSNIFIMFVGVHSLQPLPPKKNLLWVDLFLLLIQLEDGLVK